ncbi:MAG: type transport system permease protein [Actinomycetota bacterium]|jgi:ABC-type transport system involved in multi-copper enzyme maturation permease subunit|nr:type transport system permease protein [Actinomycetota bacterium]
MRTLLSRLPGTLPPLNPVLARELKQRMRGRLTWLVVTGYLAILALILRFVYLGASQSSSGAFADPLASASVGRSIFHWLLFFMLMLVCFIVPGLTASAISGERERQTLVSLQVTLLRPRSIVLGKLLSSLAFTSLLVVASLPLLSVPFLVGGVSVTEVLKGVAMILLTAVVLACLAVASSALLRRTQAATVIAYGLTAALTVGTFIVYGGQRAMDGPIGKASPAILALNPFVATADVVQGRAQSSSFDSPFTALADLIRPDTFGFATDSGFGAAGVTRVAVGKGFAPAPAGATTVPATFVPTTIGFGTGAPVPDAPVPVTPPDAAVSSDGKIVISDGSGPVGQILIDPSGGSGNGFQFGQFPVDVQPQAKVAGVRLWVAWLLTSIVIGGLALLVAVRRVSLPSARDSS